MPTLHSIMQANTVTMCDTLMGLVYLPSKAILYLTVRYSWTDVYFDLGCK